MRSPKGFLLELNHEYLTVHQGREQLFWTTHMGTSSNHAAYASAESEWTRFVSDPKRLAAVRDELEQLDTLPRTTENLESRSGLTGWLRLFELNVVEGTETRDLRDRIIEAESALFERKQRQTFRYTAADGSEVDGSLPVFRANLRASADESVRSSSLQAMHQIEEWVLSNGYLELVALRNRFAVSAGYRDFFEYAVQKTEGMSTAEEFAILDDFERRTREANLRSITELERSQGAAALLPHNIENAYRGGAERALDPYLPFSLALRRWVESFGRLGIAFRGAELTLDLLDRPGKHQNGFMHGPVPAFFDDGRWRPATINFTSNARPDVTGSGSAGIRTFFHEGGHAAHFANIAMNAPCFSQEYPPTSFAMAETQSMFCDSILEDADWLKAYAADRSGRIVPDEVIERVRRGRQPFLSFEERMLLLLPSFERALYAMSDAERTPKRTLQLARETEKRILGVESPRPILAFPHLLANDSACSYQSYLFAHMAVFQTRTFLTGKLGYLADNPQVGPLLAEHYWRPGNSVTHNEAVRGLTGADFTARYLAEECNLSADQAWEREEAKLRATAERERPPVADLDARIRVVDGERLLASNESSMEEMFEEFESAIDREYPQA